MVKKNHRIGSIDLLRTLAIFLVILFHYLYFIYGTHSLRPIGYVGISLFFIISGFLLAKHYSNIEDFQGKWFLKRIIKITSIYYLVLIAIAILFGRQVYSGNLIMNLIYHFLFIDFANPLYAYSFISPAWFLTPLIGLYLLYPYLNKMIKSNNMILIFAFGIMIILRIVDGTWTSFNPLFFIGEFCFGIAFAYNKKSLPLILSLFTIFVRPIMVLPFIIFYLGTLVEIKEFNILKYIGSKTLMLFLMHEAFLRVILGEWHIYNLSKFSAIILLTIVSIILVYLSRVIQAYLRDKGVFTGDCPENFKFFTEKKKMKNKSLSFISYLLIGLLILFIASLFISSTAEKSEEDGALGTFGLAGDQSILIVKDVKSVKQGCGTEITGIIENIGTSNATNIYLSCRPFLYPDVEESETIKEYMGVLDFRGEKEFSIYTPDDCDKKVKYDCSVICDEC